MVPEGRESGREAARLRIRQVDAFVMSERSKFTNASQALRFCILSTPHSYKKEQLWKRNRSTPGIGRKASALRMQPKSVECL
ncbi:MAG: hypothetical protein ABW206_04330, partial [Agrobacterium vaccinii]